MQKETEAALTSVSLFLSLGGRSKTCPRDLSRALYPDSSLAELYDELTMPVELRKAHQDNDRAVMQVYGFDVKTMTESQCVAELFKLYQELTK